MHVFYMEWNGREPKRKERGWGTIRKEENPSSATVTLQQTNSKLVFASRSRVEVVQVLVEKHFRLISLPDWQLESFSMTKVSSSEPINLVVLRCKPFPTYYP